MKKKNLINVILSFVKIGTIGFGGGAALIPIIESELVEKNKWMEKDSFDVVVAVASISPASLPVSICSIWDRKYSLFSAYFYALPGPIMFLILLTGFSMIGETGIRYLEYASVGILVFVLLLIYRFIKKNYLHSVDIGIKKQHIVILMASLLLNGGSVTRNLINSLLLLDAETLPEPIFAISMLNLIFILFFTVCFVGASNSRLKLCVALLVAGVYALANGRTNFLNNFSAPILTLMLIMALSSIVYDIVTQDDKSKKTPTKIDFLPLRNLLYFILIAVGITSLSYFVSGYVGVWEFAYKGVTSSLTSFGGGEVYYAIAEETFVQTGMISEDYFMSRILGFAGAMPGPVIVSILAGVGFAYGSELGGSALGWLFGLLGISMAVTATAFGATILFTVFEALKDSPRLKMIIKYIMPLVCGVLISVAITLFLRASSVISSKGVYPLICFGVVTIMFVLMLYALNRYRINDMVLLVIGGFVTLVGLTVLSTFM